MPVTSRDARRHAASVVLGPSNHPNVLRLAGVRFATQDEPDFELVAIRAESCQ